MRQGLDKLSTQILRYIPFLLAFLTPIFFLPFTSDLFVFNKFYLVSLLASLSLVAFCIRSLVRGKISLTTSPSFLPVVILVLANIISSLWLSPTKHNSLFGQTTLFFSLAIIFITTTSSQKNRLVINSIIFGLISSTVFLSLITILHRFELLSRFINFDLLSSPYFNLTGGILPALVFTIPVLLATVAYLIFAKNWILKSILFAAALFMIVASLVNLTLIFPQNGQPYLFLLPYQVSWSIAVDVFKNWQTALLGSGPETYLTAFTRLRPSYLNYNPLLWELRFPEATSFLLTLVTTTGLLGALSFFFTFMKPLSVSLKHRSANLGSPSLIFLTVSLLTILISFIIVPAGIVTVVLAFVLLIALTIEFKLLGVKETNDFSYTISAKSEPEGLYQEISDSEKITPTALVLPWIVALFSAVLLAIYWLYAIPTYKASVSAMEAQQLIDTNPVGAYAKEINATKLNPYNSGYKIALSQFFKSAALTVLNKKNATPEETKNATEYMQRSIDYGKQAAMLDPYNVIVWENLSDIYQSFIGIADNAQNFAVSHLAQAIALDSTNPKLRLKLGILFYNLGDSDQAIKIISQAIELKQNWAIPYYNISLIYKAKKDYPRALQYLRVGLQYEEQNSENYTKVQEEIKSLEKLVPAESASGSGTVQ